MGDLNITLDPKDYLEGKVDLEYNLKVEDEGNFEIAFDLKI